MRRTRWNRIARWVTARTTRAAPSDAGNPGGLGPAQIQPLVTRLRDLEGQVRDLTEQCAALQETASVHDWSLEALWEAVDEPRAPDPDTGASDPGPPRKKTLN